MIGAVASASLSQTRSARSCGGLHSVFARLFRLLSETKLAELSMVCSERRLARTKIIKIKL